MLIKSADDKSQCLELLADLQKSSPAVRRPEGMVARRASEFVFVKQMPVQVCRSGGQKL